MQRIRLASVGIGIIRRVRTPWATWLRPCSCRGEGVLHSRKDLERLVLVVLVEGGIEVAVSSQDGGAF